MLESIPFGPYLLLDRNEPRGGWNLCGFDEHGEQNELIIYRVHRGVSEDREGFEASIDALSKDRELAHPNLAQIHDIGLISDTLFLCGERVSGPSLIELLMRCTRLRLRLPIRVAVFIASELLGALDALHLTISNGGQTASHRECSPDNLLISFDGSVKLGHRGIRPIGSSDPSLVGQSLNYLSPEEQEGHEPDIGSDLYKMGIILYEMLALKRFLEGQDRPSTQAYPAQLESLLSELPDDTPERLIRVLQRSLDVDPEQRFDSAMTFRKALVYPIGPDTAEATRDDLARFVKSLFAREMEEERLRRREVRQAVDSMSDPVWSLISTTRHISFLSEQSEQPQMQWRPESRFKARDITGRHIGPISLDALKNLFSRSGDQTIHSVCVDGSIWVDPAILDNLDVVRVEEVIEKSEFSGPFDAVDLPRLLYRYLVCGVNGCLRVKSDDRILDLYISDGRAEAVMTSGMGDIGDYLVQSGLMDQGLLDQIRAATGSTGLYDLLLRTETLNPHQLTRTASDFARLSLVSLFEWPNGTYEFFAGRAPTADALTLDALVYPLINEGIEDLMDHQTIADFFSSYEDPKLVRMRHRHLDLSNLLLSTRQLRIWNSVRSGQTVSEQVARLGAMPGIREEQVYRILFLMERVELLALADEDHNSVAG